MYRDEDIFQINIFQMFKHSNGSNVRLSFLEKSFSRCGHRMKDKKRKMVK